MQGGPGPGRGIYVTRRVLAALVVLLLLVLLVPWACQNLIGSGEQPGSESSETADVDSSDEGGEEAAQDEEVNTNEEAALPISCATYNLVPLGSVAGFEVVGGA